ncbi:hypothetical protein GCM10022205_43280 [Spinactinospora alkalitolerans]
MAAGHDSALPGHATYRGLGEQRPSPGRRGSKGRRTVGPGLAPLVAAVLFLPPLDLPEAQQTLGGVLTLLPLPLTVGLTGIGSQRRLAGRATGARRR